MAFILAALPEKPPWWDVAWATWALTVVGFGGTIAAIWTLLTIRRQTKAIEQQVREMRTGADLTEKLIFEATQQSIAAKKSAEALINTERAWIMVELEWVPGYSGGRFLGSQIIGDEGQTFNTSVPIRFIYTNEGKTIAWIDEKLACFQIVKELPKEPDLSVLEILDPVPEWVGVKGGGKLDQTLQADGQESIECSMSVIWGVIKYRDAFNARHVTVFGFRIRPDNSFVRLTGLTEYNKTS